MTWKFGLVKVRHHPTMAATLKGSTCMLKESRVVVLVFINISSLWILAFFLFFMLQPRPPPPPEPQLLGGARWQWSKCAWFSNNSPSIRRDKIWVGPLPPGHRRGEFCIDRAATHFIKIDCHALLTYILQRRICDRCWSPSQPCRLKKRMSF